MKRPTPPAAEPTEPTVGATAANPEGGSAEPPKDSYEARFREGQRYATKLSMENADLRRRLEALEAGYEADDDGDDAGEQAPVLSRFRTAEPARPRVPTSAADLAPAQSVHGPEAVEVYGRLADLLDQAVTPADKLTVLELYREMRSSGDASSARRPEPPASRRPTRDEVVTPTVQTNRPDAVYPDGEPDPKRFEGGANGGVGGWLREKFGATAARGQEAGSSAVGGRFDHHRPGSR